MNVNPPVLSVIIVSYNPRSDLLAWALDSLEKQTLSKDLFEVIVVDNNSEPPLQLEDLTRYRTLHLHLAKEPQQGTTFARSTGIAESRSPLLLFVDDDNHLDPDYLEQGLRIADKHPEIGAFGGIARGVFETPLQPWQEKLLPSLGVRDYGSNPIISQTSNWGPWEPIGAGMFFRREVGQAFVDFLSCGTSAHALGRKGTSFIAGEDALLAQCAYRIGYACSYQPALMLDHYMKKQRLTFRNLCRTISAHGHAEVILYRILGRQDARSGLPRNIFILLAGLLAKVFTKGIIAGYVAWQWDVGWWKESRTATSYSDE